MTTQGLYTKLFQELAGLGGDASFYKAEAECQISRPLVPGIVCLGFASLNPSDDTGTDNLVCSTIGSPMEFQPIEPFC
jgi:outer membrane protein assembly factor BamA